MPSEHKIARVRDCARKWHNAVKRGDVSLTYAAYEAVGEATYPYCEVGDFDRLMAEAKRVLR